MTSMLEKWITEFYLKEERAVRGLGKYRLAPGYDQFQVDPVKWNRWGPERQAQHLSALRNFTPKSYGMYKKPRAAGLHRVKQGEFTCQNPKSSPTELKLAMANLKQSPLFDSQRVMTRQSGR